MGYKVAKKKGDKWSFLYSSLISKTMQLQQGEEKRDEKVNDEPTNVEEKGSTKTNEPTAIVLIGNSGVGKSSILNQLGANFLSGLRDRESVTKEIEEHKTEINGKPLILIDIPGLVEPGNTNAGRNSKLFKKALSKRYRYKIIFVLRADNRIVLDDDLLVISEVSRSVRSLSPNGITFGVIVNLIQGQAQYSYYEELSGNNFQEYFQQRNHDTNFTFNFTIKESLLLKFNENVIMEEGYRDKLVEFIEKLDGFKINVERKIDVSKENYSNFLKANIFGAGGFFVALAILARFASL
jgi:GTP-binding protein EngB required for normal cell division